MNLRVPLAGLVALFFVFTSFARAQQQPTAPTLPDTPAPKQDDVKPQGSAKTPLSLSVDLVARRSFFYPDLAATPGPLSTPEKFELFLTNSISTSRLLASITSAAINQARNSPSGYYQGGDGYAKRFGSSMASAASSQFFGTFLIPSVLHDDPRYFVHYNSTFRQRAKLALRRMVLTRTDDGRESLNYPGILGPMLAESLANSYLPDNERTVRDTLARSGARIGFAVANNFLKEYWPTIFKDLRINKVIPSLEPVSPAEPPPPPSEKPRQ